MRPFQGSIWGCALAALAAATAPASAAWNNVFQVCCASCGRAPAVAGYYSGYAPSACCPQPCCPQTCTTRYVQRCYYQPVTCYQQKTYYEPVTTYRTSYYYESVCSYRYSCYYDPCSCSYQQVAQPVTSYRLRSQCCPVTSYLQRCCMVPVTTYQQVTMYEPVTSCCSTPCAPSCQPAGPSAAAAPAVPAVPADPGAPPPPSTSETPSVPGSPPPPPPTTSDGLGSFRRDYPRGVRQTTEPPPAMPRATDGTSLRQPQLRQPVPAAPRVDRIAALSGHATEGQLVGAARAPQAGVRVMFVSADQTAPQQSVTTDASGRFQVSLASGAWLVYTEDTTGRPVFQQKVQVRGGAPMQMTLVSR